MAVVSVIELPRTGAQMLPKIRVQFTFPVG